MNRFFTIIPILVLTVLSAQAIRIKSGPYLQNVTENDVTIMWRTDKPATAWVELAPDDDTDFYACERPRYYSTRIGRAVVDTLHCVTISNLTPGTHYRYRVFSEEVIDMVPWHVNYGGIAATDIWQHKPLRFRTADADADAESVEFLVVNDIHGNNDVLSDLMKNVDKEKTDFVLFNGDMVSWMNNEEQVFDDFVDTSTNTFASETPFVMVRGNHETRGNWCNEYMRYFRTNTGLPYFAFRQGPVYFVVLDSGEDKPDSDIEYSRTSFFDQYRTEQAQWLKGVVESDEFKNAPYRVVVVHMPPIYTDWHGLIEVKEKFLPLINDKGIDLMLSGHFHKYDYTEPGSRGVNFPILINSNEDALRVKADGSKMTVDVINREGKVTHTFSYPQKNE